MDSVISISVLFQFLTGLAALLAISTQYLWYDKRTKKFKIARNLFFVLTIILFAIGMWVTINDNQEKSNARLGLQKSFDSIKHNFDSIKVDLEKNTWFISKLDSQISPFILLAKKRYPNLNSDEALSKLRGDVINNGSIVTSYNQKGGVTAQTNNGIINQGGEGNTYHQQINPEVPQRHFTIVDADWLIKKISSKP